MQRFAATADAIAATSGKHTKTRLLMDYLRSLDDASLAVAAVFFTGRPFPQRDQRKLAVGWASVNEALGRLVPPQQRQLAEGAFKRFGDLGELAEHLLEGLIEPTGLSLVQSADAFAALEATGGATEKTAKLTAFLRLLGPREAKYVIKLITGELRIGLVEGLVEEALAAAFNADLDAVRTANMFSGDIGRVAVLARHGRLGEVEPELFHPIKCMLAKPEPTLEAVTERLGATELWVEDKYDGLRAQLHKGSDRAVIYSRDMKDATIQFPEIARAALGLPGELVLDGEIVAYNFAADRVLPFFDLQQRLGRKGVTVELQERVPLNYIVFDLLYQDREMLWRLPLAERRRRLEALPFPTGLALAPLARAQGAEALRAAFQAARGRGNEGLMVKDPQSAYSPGRRGFAWIKYKEPLDPLDVVVTAVEWGHGKRKGVLSDYTFAVRDEADGALVDIGKAYSGLTDPEIAQLTDHFQSITVQDLGYRRLVQPTLVLEVAFESIQRSSRHASGFALRFPRILRVRTDKTPADINTLSDVRERYETLERQRRGRAS